MLDLNALGELLGGDARPSVFMTGIIFRSLWLVDSSSCRPAYARSVHIEMVESWKGDREERAESEMSSRLCLCWVQRALREAIHSELAQPRIG